MVRIDERPTFECICVLKYDLVLSSLNYLKLILISFIANSTNYDQLSDPPIPAESETLN